MNISDSETLGIDKLTEVLSDYAIDRSEMHALISYIPKDANINRTAIEYEIQLLRILAVGWGINYYIKQDSFKQTLSESYWNSIREFSNNISSISALSSSALDSGFDYFEIIKQRLEIYLDEMRKHADSNEPTASIGPKFAQLCGHQNNAIIVWMGSKMFQSVLNQIKTYLSETKFISTNNTTNTQSGAQ